MLLGAFEEAKTELVESRREREEIQAKLHNTDLLLLQARKELEESISKPAKQMTLSCHGDEVISCMYGYSLYKHTGKVWHSPPFYYEDGYKLCLAVYANGKGAGAGTHVSGELLQMKEEHDDKLSSDTLTVLLWRVISIQMVPKVQAPEEQISLHHHICANCFDALPPPEDLRVFKNCHGHEGSEDKFVDHKVQSR